MKGLHDLRRLLFKTWLSPLNSAHSFETRPNASLGLMANVQGIVLWSESGLSGRKSYVDSRCWSPRNGVLA
eukprot:521321-Pyramimonas_sp.AAC.1